MITITGSGCELYQGASQTCVRSANYAENYEPGASCSIEFSSYPAFIDVLAFDTRGWHDYFTMNGVRYTGSEPSRWPPDGEHDAAETG